MTQSGMLETRRRQQTVQWMHALIDEELKRRFAEHPVIKQRLPALEALVVKQAMPVATAVETIFQELMLSLSAGSPAGA